MKSEQRIEGKSYYVHYWTVLANRTNIKIW